MKTIADKKLLVGADRSGFPLKEIIVKHLQDQGWEITDIGVRAQDEKEPEMFHRIGLKVGAKIAEGEFERALIFCGTGMGIHLAASKCPHVYCAVVESVAAAKRAITGNNCNVLSMGARFVSPETAIEMVDIYLSSTFCQGHEDWENFREFHQLAYDELEAFDYEEFKANGFQPKILGNVKLGPRPEGMALSE